ncbi:MAG TPA: response regulator [Gemmatimonadaceae bacterium]|jgi:DNA-binding response OmpR family regulator
MKILIAEDEPMLRSTIKRIAGHSAKIILEADNGLDALTLIEREDPDLLITDLQMPLLDGYDVIAALRDSEKYRHLPVICLTVENRASDVSRVSALGISDYLLKPVKPIELTERIRRVLRWKGNWRNKRDDAPDGRDKLLVIEPDPNFRAFIRPLLDAEFEVIEAPTAAEGLAAYKRLSVKPNRILISDAEQLLSATRVAELFGRVATSDNATMPSIYLLSDHDTAAPPQLFAGVVRRTFVPQRFVDSMRQCHPGLRTAGSRIREMLADRQRPWLLSAVRQTFGVLYGQEVNALPAPEDGAMPDVAASIELVVEGTGCKLRAFVACASAHAERVATTVLGRSVTMETGGSDLLSESANTIGGRIKATLIERGFSLRLGLPEIATGDVKVNPDDWDTVAWVGTSSDDRFFVAVKIEESDTIEVSAASTSARNAAAAAAAEAELESVLF